jgi:hypothetical protein
MTEEKIDYLGRQLFALGLKSLQNELEQGLRSNLPEFSFSRTASYSPEGKAPVVGGTNDRFTLALDYRSSEKTGDPYLHSIRAELEKANGKTEKNTFDLIRFPWLTGKEMYNLLSGRSVQKEVPKRDADGKFLRLPDGAIDKQPVWFKLELDKTNIYGDHPHQTFYPGYKYDLTKSLGTYRPDNYANEEKRNEMLKELRKGNLVEATIPIGKKKAEVLLAANPEDRVLDVYETKTMKPVLQESIFPELKKKATAMTEGSATVQHQPERELSTVENERISARSR